MAFNLADMINKRPVQSTETENISDTVYRDVFELIPSRENFYSTDPEKLQGLKNSILLFGVLQDVLIEDVDGRDRIISGHCRTMCCRMLVEEGHEEFRKINCKYTKVNLNTEDLPDDGEGKVDQLLNKLVVIQANRFREKSDWEKMQEALVTEEVIKELRELVDLQGTTRNMVQATLGISGTQLERYHAIQKKLSSELMEEYKAAKINISVARELADLDEVHQKEALELYKTNGVLTLPDAKALKEKQEVTRQIPGQLTLAEAVGQRRPPEDDTVIDAEVQITRFFESLKKSTTERIYKQDKNMTIYMLSTIYNSVRIRNGHLNYQGKTNGILFNPGSEQEMMISWQQLAETLIAKYGKKQKTVKVAPLPEVKECPRYDLDEVFTPDIARMVRSFLESCYTNLFTGCTKRFRVMGTEYAATHRVAQDEFVFYNADGTRICRITKARMDAEYKKLTAPEEETEPENEVFSKLDEVTNSWGEWDPQEAVKEFCTRHPEMLKEIMQICREYKNNGDRAKEIQKKLAPHGFSAGGDGVFDYSFEVFWRGATFRSATKKKKIQMKYGRLIMELLNLYDPYSPEFYISEEKTDMSESDMSECCQQAAENTDEKQQVLTQNERDSFFEISNMALDAWPDELKDLPVPTLESVLRYLQKEEKNLEEMQVVAAEESGFPVNVLKKAQMNVAGLRLLRNLVSTCLDSGEIAKEETSEQPPLPVMKNNDQRKEWLRNYKDWGIWYKDEHIGATFYKYEFENGACLIVEAYTVPKTKWSVEHDSAYYHLVKGPEQKEKDGIPKWTVSSQYSRWANSETELVEFLKEIQRKDR